MFMKLMKGLSAKAVDVFIKFLNGMKCGYSYPQSYKQCHLSVSNRFHLSKCIEDASGFFRVNVVSQIQLIIENNFAAFMNRRRQLLSSNNIDIISSSKHLSCDQPFIVHLIFCADGTSVFRTRSDSYWPLQLQILDLPLHVRQKFHNRILYMLFTQKPDWKTLSNMHQHLSGSFVVKRNNITYNFSIKLFKCMFDLPGLASIANITQFNGEYGCPFCLHPGIQIQVGRGTARKYPILRDANIDKRTDSHYRQCLRSCTKIFGIKGPSHLFTHLRMPEDIVFDAMHSLYEGVAKQYLLFSTTPSIVRHCLKFTSATKLSYIHSFITSLEIPHDFVTFRSLEHLRVFKATELQNYLFYLFVPLYLSVTPIECALHIMTLTYIIRLSYSDCITNEVSGCVFLLVEKFLLSSESILPGSFFTLNHHLISHLVDQLRSCGPLQNCSMFSFEAGMKKIKSFCHGSVSFGKQIVEGFLLYKELYFEIESNQEAYSQFSEVMNYMHVFDRKANENDQRCVMNGIIFHSLEYKFRKESSSYLCFLTSGEFAEIVSFFVENGERKALVKLFKTISLLDFLSESIGHNDLDIFDALKKVDSLTPVPFFSIVDEIPPLSSAIPIDKLCCKAIRMKTFIVKQMTATVVTPVFLTGEHK